jgi:tetratricopeptide (TPR) repeat protein
VTDQVAHLDSAQLAALDSGSRSLLFHVATCSFCRKLVAEDLDERRREAQDAAAADAAILRLLGELERGVGLDGKIAAIERQRREARDLVRELLGRPDSWGAAVADPRYASPEVVWQLLEAAAGEAPAVRRQLIGLAGDIAVELAALDPAASLHMQLLVEVRCARAHLLLDTGRGTEAARELRNTAGMLRPDLGYSRAVFCRALARLRREQKRWEEALALVDRAVSLFHDYGSPFENGQAQVEQGWLLIDAGEPDEAIPILGGALPLVEGVAPCAVIGRLGLVAAQCECGGRDEARRLLAEADAITAEVIDPAIRQRLRWLGGQVARRCGHGPSAFRRLCRSVDGFFALGEDQDAARVLLELVALCLEHGWLRALQLPTLQLAFGTLFESPQLHPRAGTLIGFVAYVLQDPGPRRAAEVVANASRYLVEARDRPELPFLPTRSERLVHLEWDEIEPQLRSSICLEVGAGEAPAGRAAQELDTDLRDLISWRFEVLRRVRIVFSGGQPEPPAA